MKKRKSLAYLEYKEHCLPQSVTLAPSPSAAFKAFAPIPAPCGVIPRRPLPAGLLRSELCLSTLFGTAWH